MVETVRIEEIGGREGNCITINDTRVAGPKPWGGGYVIKKWDARVDHILRALGVDVAEVVRCKDCKFGEMCSVREAMACVDESGFCWRGERKNK